jgi:ATP-dependent exoDNAse (exonuclease V) alpha subunit
MVQSIQNVAIKNQQSPSYSSFLVARGESEEYIKKCPDFGFFKACAENGILDMVDDWKVFVSASKALKANPFMKEHFGDGMENLIPIRTKLSHMFTSDSIKCDTLRTSFAVWVFFESKTGSVYSPHHLFSPFCTKYTVNVEDFFDHVVRHNEFKKLYTSRDIRKCETDIVKWLKNAEPLHHAFEQVDVLDEAQNSAIKKIMSSKFSVVQGNAGCGKTTSICEMMKQINKNQNVRIIAAAYTHKAKKCIEMRLRTAGLGKVFIGTVHAVIGIIHHIAEDNGPQENIFLVLDEASMLDVELLGQLAFTMMESGARYQVCFVGDFFQIQPVGRGELFRQLVQDDKDIVCKLSKCYRTDKTDLFDAYELLRSGKLPKSSEHFKVEMKEDDKDTCSFVGKFIMKHLDSYQLIAWQNKHLGVLNTWVQKALVKANKIGPGHFKKGAKEFYVNDRVIYCGENTEDITNSMNGTVVNIDSSGLWIKWEHKAKHVIYKDIYGIYLAYAISAHKSQGSEYKNVLVVCYEVEKMTKCLDRRWLYTSCTRGQENVVVAATPNITAFVEKPLSKIPIHNIKICYDDECDDEDELKTCLV